MWAVRSVRRVFRRSRTRPASSPRASRRSSSALARSMSFSQCAIGSAFLLIRYLLLWANACPNGWVHDLRTLPVPRLAAGEQGAFTTLIHQFAGSVMTHSPLLRRMPSSPCPSQFTAAIAPTAVPCPAVGPRPRRLQRPGKPSEEIETVEAAGADMLALPARRATQRWQHAPRPASSGGGNPATHTDVGVGHRLPLEETQ